MSAFPYLVMTSRNRRQYSATKASRGAPNGTGYKGWYNPNQPRIMEAGEPLNAIIPRDEWIERITTGQGSMLSDIVKQAGIPVKNQDGLGYCWVYGSTSCVEERKQRLTKLELISDGHTKQLAWFEQVLRRCSSCQRASQEIDKGGS